MAFSNPIEEIAGADLLDWARWNFQLKSDFALSQFLGILPANISKIRRGHIPISSSLLVELLDSSNMSLRYLKAAVIGYREARQLKSMESAFEPVIFTTRLHSQ